MRQTTFFLEPTPPFRLDLTVWALRRRRLNAVDCWDGQTYRRALALGDAPAVVEVTQVASPDTPCLQVVVTGTHAAPEAPVTSVLQRLLGFDIDLAPFYQFAASDEHLAPLAARFRGFKPPRYTTLFEALLNAVASQQVTLNLAIQLLNRLAASYGAAASDLHMLPHAEALVDKDPEELRKLGFSGQKARTIIELAGVYAEGRLTLAELVALDDETAMKRLRQFRGIGSWSAEYVLLRGLGRLHIYPGNDSGARNGLRHWLGLSETLDYEGVHRTFARWRPYAGLIYLHLLLNGLAESQLL